MRTVDSLERYYEIINSAKKRLGRLVTNNCLFPEAIERYIELGRFFYEEMDAGLILYSDEENFYQAYYYLKPDMEVSFEKKDKQILLQHIYIEGRKKEDVERIEAQMIASGFQKVDTLRHAVLEDAGLLLHKIENTIPRIKRVFRKAGLTYSEVKKEQLERVAAFQKTIQEIPDYQMPYFTEEEYLQEAKEGKFCCITDESGNIIAARHLIVNGKKTYGWVGVQEQYKNLYGIAIFFLFHALQYIYKNDLKMCSWVDVQNIPSIQYHEHIGSKWTGHIEDEWILKGGE